MSLKRKFRTPRRMIIIGSLEGEETHSIWFGVSHGGMSIFVELMIRFAGRGPVSQNVSMVPLPLMLTSPRESKV